MRNNINGLILSVGIFFSSLYNVLYRAASKINKENVVTLRRVYQDYRNGASLFGRKKQKRGGK